MAGLLAVVALRAFVLGWAPVESASMSPTVEAGEVVVVDRVLWRAGGLARGDLVTLTTPRDGGHLVKRVVALPGQEVRIDDAVLVVDGRPVTESYVDASRIDGTYFGPVTVPPGMVFVLGDNRAGSVDSRVFGPVPLTAVTGRVVLVLP